ncbi:MAG: LysR family transcriptional regulator [Gemmatimonadaceae bacterium]|nr:LysR family transcriptional regulator [Gemmatimonadaceae bacterium]
MATPSLNSLNYQHLLYFWVVAREGSIAQATTVLHLTQPTISTQLKQLEASIGTPLFVRRGRGLVLTDTGQLVFQYADEMFRAGRELTEALARGEARRPTRLVVGLSDSLPKLTTVRLLRPALAAVPDLQLILRIDKTDRLVAELAVHAVDVVLTDAPVSPSLHVTMYTQLLGECGVTVFGTQALQEKYRRKFPQSLTDAPFIMPTTNTAVRRSLDAWCIAHDIRPRIVCESEDVALLQVFGQDGLGLFAAPTVVEAQIRAAYNVRVVGRLPDVRERFYAMTAERKLAHPAVVALTTAAQQGLFR